MRVRLKICMSAMCAAALGLCGQAGFAQQRAALPKAKPAALTPKQLARYEVPKELRDMVNLRKAELAPVKVGIGAFRHLYEVKPKSVGVVTWQPEGEPVVWDFEKSIPPECRNSLRDGEYRHIQTAKGRTRRTSVNNDIENYSVQVKVRQISEVVPDQGYGLFLNVNGQNGDGYLFMIRKNGETAFFKYSNRNWTAVKSWTKWNNLVGKKGGDILQVEVHGGTFLCSVNGTQVFTVNDSSFRKGKIDFYIDDAMEVAFDDLVIQPLAVATDPLPVGSGYDYADEVLGGMARSGLFAPAQLGISNYPPNEDFDYIAGAREIGYAYDGGVKFVIQKSGEDEPLIDEQLPLPDEWDRKASSGGIGAAAGETPRGRVMARLGEYLAYRLAEVVLSPKPAVKNGRGQ